MEKYKRLTAKKATTENTKVFYNENGFAIFHKELIEALLEEHNRLWELENKIENGTLVDTTEKFITEETIKDKKRYLIAEAEIKNEVLCVELSRYTEHCIEMKNGTLKQFAERLKIESVNKIHETLKEFINV